MHRGCRKAASLIGLRRRGVSKIPLCRFYGHETQASGMWKAVDTQKLTLSPPKSDGKVGRRPRGRGSDPARHRKKPVNRRGDVMTHASSGRARLPFVRPGTSVNLQSPMRIVDGDVVKLGNVDLRHETWADRATRPKGGVIAYYATPRERGFGLVSDLPSPGRWEILNRFGRVTTVGSTHVQFLLYLNPKPQERKLDQMKATSLGVSGVGDDSEEMKVPEEALQGEVDDSNVEKDSPAKDGNERQTVVKAPGGWSSTDLMDLHIDVQNICRSVTPSDLQGVWESQLMSPEVTVTDVASYTFDFEGASGDEVTAAECIAAFQLCWDNPLYFLRFKESCCRFEARSEEDVRMLISESGPEYTKFLARFEARLKSRQAKGIGPTMMPKRMTYATNLSRLTAKVPEEDKTWNYSADRKRIEKLIEYSLADEYLQMKDPMVFQKYIAPFGFGAFAGDCADMLGDLGIQIPCDNVHRLRTTLPMTMSAEEEEIGVRAMLEAGPDPDVARRVVLGKETPCYVIDSADASEVDDGLSLTRIDGDEWILVHVADAGRYAPVDSPLDLIGRRRASSIYLPEMRSPMFPRKVSVEAMSLRPDGLGGNYAFTVGIRMSDEGDIIDSKIFLAKAENVVEINYPEVDRILSGEVTSPHYATLARLEELSKIRNDWRLRNGAILLKNPKPQPKVTLDRVNGDHKIDIVFDNASTGSRAMVADLMILAGDTCSRYCQQHNIPMSFRSQFVDGNRFECPFSAEELEALPESVREYYTLRTLENAQPALDVLPHTAMGLDAYCTVTSPIRRYMDILLHHQIRAHLRGEPLPFTGPKLWRTVSHLGTTLKKIKKLEDASDKFWVLRQIERDNAKSTRLYKATVLEIEDEGTEKEDAYGSVLLNDYAIQTKGRLSTEVSVGDDIVVTSRGCQPWSGFFRIKQHFEIKRKTFDKRERSGSLNLKDEVDDLLETKIPSL